MIDEATVDRSVVRIAEPGDGGKLRGTGFVAGDDGTVLTCDHVIGALDHVVLDTLDGERHDVEVQAAARLREIDLALLKCAPLGRRALPLARGGHVAMPYWSKGFHQQSSAVRAPLPVSGTVLSHARVTYSAGASQFDIAGVLALQEESFDEGLSGSPLLDAEWGVVVGVINAAFRGESSVAGFAIPFQAVTNPDIDALLGANERTQPRFGPYLNASGARTVCGAQVSRNLRFLRDTDVLVGDEENCAREPLEAAFERFARADERVFVIVGRSGVGKTTAISRLAEARPGAIFMSARLIPASIGEGIQSAIAGEVAVAAGRNIAVPAPADALANALGPGKLFVFLDALNEAPGEVLEGFEHWIGRTLAWARDTGARLVVTMRPEYWALVQTWFGGDLVFDTREEPGAGGSEGKAFVLGDFSAEEAERAAKAYGLADADLSFEDVRHPLFLRIYRELARRRDIESLSRYDALEAFVQKKVEAAARALGSPTSVRVESALNEVAIVTAQRKTLVIDDRAFGSLQKAFGEAVEQLVTQNLLVQTTDGYGFAFDEIGHFLQAGHVDLDAILADAENLEWQQLQTAVFALIREEHLCGSAALADRLHSLLDAQPDDDRSFWPAWIIIEVLGRASQPVALLDVVARWVSLPMASFIQVHDTYNSLQGSLADKLEVLRVAVRLEDAYDWEWHHWHGFPVHDPSRHYGPASAAGELMASRPREVAPLLAAWLEDDTALTGTQGSTVADVAAGLLALYADRALNDIVDLLAGRRKSKAQYLLRTILSKHPTAAVEICERWSMEGSSQRERASMCANWLLATELRADLKRRLLTVQRDIFSSPPTPLARNEAAHALAGDPENRALVLDELATAFAEGATDVSPSVLASGLATDFDVVLAAFEARAMRDPQEYDYGLLDTLATYTPKNDAEGGRVLAVFESLWAKGPGEPDGLLTLALLRFARHSHAPRERLLALLGSIAISGTTQPLNDLAAAALTTSHDPEFRRALFDLLVMTERAEARRALAAMSARVTRNNEPDSVDENLIDRALAASSEELDSVGMELIFAARHSEPFAAALAREVRNLRVAPGGVLDSFAKSVAAGSSPQAAAQATDERMWLASLTGPKASKNNTEA